MGGGRLPYNSEWVGGGCPKIRPGHETRRPGTLSWDCETRRPGTLIQKSRDSLRTLEKIFTAWVRTHISDLIMSHRVRLSQIFIESNFLLYCCDFTNAFDTITLHISYKLILCWHTVPLLLTSMILACYISCLSILSSWFLINIGLMAHPYLLGFACLSTTIFPLSY